MKYLSLTIAVAACIALIFMIEPRSQATSQNPAEDETSMETRHRTLSPERQERIARRKARQAEYERFIDSTIMSHNYRFIPQTFNLEPAGATQLISNPNFELVVYTDYVDINLPFIKGYTPPYRLVVLNTIVTQVNGYAAIQNDGGWTVSFSSWLYTGSNYTFTFNISSRTGGTQVQIESDFFNTVSYWGSVYAVY